MTIQPDSMPSVMQQTVLESEPDDRSACRVVHFATRGSRPECFQRRRLRFQHSPEIFLCFGRGFSDDNGAFEFGSVPSNLDSSLSDQNISSPYFLLAEHRVWNG